MTVIKRLITSWVAAAYIVLISVGGLQPSKTFPDKAFAAEINIFLFLAVALSFFLILTASPKLWRRVSYDDLALAFFLGLYSLILTLFSENVMSVIAVLVPVTIAVFYLFYQNKSKIPVPCIFPRFSFASACVIAAIMAAVIALYTCMRYLSFSSPNYDFGIFCNMFSSMARDFTQTVSSERDEIVQHFAIHFSPVYYLMLPFYFIFRSPLTLQILQALIVASGIIPLWLLSRRRGLTPLASAVLSAVYALYPALSLGCSYDLHENCFLTVFILWLFWAAERPVRRENILLFVFAVLTLSVKEDAAVYVAFAGIYLAVSDGFDRPGVSQPEQHTGKSFRCRLQAFLTPTRRNGMLLICISVAWFGFTSWYLTKYGYGVMSSRYLNFIPDGGSLTDMLHTVLLNPALVFSEAFETEKMIFLAQMLLPLALIPLVTRKPHRLLLLLPFLLINLMSDYTYQHSIYFQYIFGSTAFLFYGTILNLSDMTGRLRKALLALALAASTLFFGAFVTPKASYYTKRYFNNREQYALLEDCLDEIPKSASVTCSTFLLPHIADREEIYQLKDSAKTAAATDCVVIDLRGVANNKANEFIDAYTTRGYIVMRCEYDLILIVAKE